ncbi:MAG TPA: D-2-hydroxyacid dehydrogenase [Candidatus Olsenella avistercoris]|nr:D-2-hydroxyacid dehydrogenase [Candidatus Olsenella avistercoris]
MNVLVLLPVSAAQRALLEDAAPGATFAYATAADATDEQVAAAEVIVGNLPPARLAAARGLRLLQLNSAGYDDYVAAGALPAGAMLASASGAYGQAVSEHMLAMLLSMMKRLPAYRDAQRAHEWVDLGSVTSLSGARVLVLGAGDIGTHFARLCASLGARVTGVRRRPSEPHAPFSAMGTFDELTELLPQADVVASVLPSAPGTRRLADAAFFSAMRGGAFFVNAGRGDLVVAEDLVAALESGHLAGAALDVTDPEPLPADHPLWDAPGALVTPHVSGWYHLPVTLDNIVGIAADNLARLARGEKPRNLVER